MFAHVFRFISNLEYFRPIIRMHFSLPPRVLHAQRL